MISTRPFLSVEIQKTKQPINPSVNNNINIINNRDSTTVEPSPSAEVQEVHEEKQEITDEKYLELLRENEALKLILQINKSNPLIINGFIVADDETLARLIGLLTDADQVEIDADDYVAGCVTKNTYRKVNSILVTKNNQLINFKYGFGEANKLLADEKITTKFVY